MVWHKFWALMMCKGDCFTLVSTVLFELIAKSEASLKFVVWNMDSHFSDLKALCQETRLALTQFWCQEECIILCGKRLVINEANTHVFAFEFNSLREQKFRTICQVSYDFIWNSCVHCFIVPPKMEGSYRPLRRELGNVCGESWKVCQIFLEGFQKELEL